MDRASTSAVTRRCSTCHGLSWGVRTHCDIDGGLLLIDRVGMVVGNRFVIDGFILHRPSSASIWRASDRLRGGRVVIKFHVGCDEIDRQRFARGARLSMGVQDPRVNRTIAHGTTDDDESYVVLDELEGTTLSELLAIEQLETQTVLELAIDVLDGLTALHDAGLIHRDIKPDNLYVVAADDRLRATVADFGIARQFGPIAHLNRVTKHLKICGTPHYMAPEQVTDDELDPRTDLYAVGATIFHALTGGLPHPGPLPADFYRQKLATTARSLSEVAPSRTFSPALHACVSKALELHPDERFQSARDMRRVLARLAKPS